MNKLKLLPIALLLAACGSNSNKQETKNTEPSAKTSITIKGSDTVLPLSQKEAEAYMKQHPDASITVVGGGSGVGISALMESATDIAMSSRPLKMDEKLKLEENKIEVVESIIGFDALAVVVNPGNAIGKLTQKQIADMFTGKIKNWKEVGGKDLKVICYSRESSSGTYEFFKEHVMDKKNYASDVLNMPATGAIIQSVSQTEGAIGYVGLAYETKDVKHLEVSYDDGKTFVAPSVENAKNKSYPISRPLYYFYTKASEPKVKPFVDYILSAEGQKLVSDVGYVPL
ncbi:MAG TPA: PstS family phosphate ABC transporter substrate-binding protein [Bacteroidia bacterium]|nr:PstS family phosphate ABC transporter substrate-binding protein [Bacteroidia bacterium]HNU32950.1 PstS family phosphate ABC transporter substrate-binding protein [Bacteroidia bacterium]